MPTLFIGLLVLILGLWLLKSFARTNPKDVIRVGRTAGGIVALAGAAFLGARGELSVAVPLGITGLGILGWWPGNPLGILGRGSPSGGQTSKVRSNFLDVTLDHDSGAMTGTIVAGRLKGTPLDQLEVSALIALMEEFDPESRDLLAAYLDRRHPRWRENTQDSSATGDRRPSRSSKMTEEEAYQILGLQPGASAEDIGRAHRGLMKKLHPDQGGSTYLAARVNEAKEVLLRRH
jgi:hypothetical protein